jgi:hypothetical protein
MTPPRTRDSGSLQSHMRGLKHRVVRTARRRVHESGLETRFGRSEGLLRPLNQHVGQWSRSAEPKRFHLVMLLLLLLAGSQWCAMVSMSPV